MKYRIGFLDGKAITALLSVFDTYEDAEKMVVHYHKDDESHRIKHVYYILNCFDDGKM